MIHVQGIGELGGQVAVTAGISSVTKLVASYPSCTVTVYETGTTNLVSLFTDSAGTIAKANPFTASATDASWSFYCAAQRIDIRFSGGSIVTPFTLSDITVGDPGSTPAESYASLLAAVTDIGSTVTTLVISKASFPSGGSTTVPTTMILEWRGAGTLLLGTGHVVTLNSDTSGYPRRQVFLNALSGQGTVLLTTNPLGSIYAEWWKANTVPGTTDMTGAINIALASLTRGGTVELLATTYLTGQINFTNTATQLTGQGMHTSSGTKPTTLLYTGLANNSSGIVNPGYYSCSVRNLYMELITGTGGAGIKFTTVAQAVIENVGITLSRGATAIGIQFGDRLGGQTNSVTTSIIRHCTVGGPGDVTFLIGSGSTSIHLDNCYALGATNAGFEFFGSTYSTLTSCAADSGLTGAYGYFFSGANGITLTSCGAENNGKGFAQLTATSVGITLISCRGVGNNISMDATIGRFLQLEAGVNIATTLIGCIDTPYVGDVSSTLSINGLAGNLWTNIIGYNTNSLPLGVGGDATWKGTYLSLIEGGSAQFSALTLGIGTGGRIVLMPKTDTYSASFLINTDITNHILPASNGTSATCTISPSAVGAAGTPLIITTEADASGSVTVTFGGTFHSSGTQVTTASHFSTIEFLSDGTRYVERNRTTNLA